MDKPVSSESEVNMKKTIWNHQAMTWYCDRCGQHWLTEPTGLPETWRLVCLADLTLDGATPPGTSYALTVAGLDPSVCLACGAKMTQLVDHESNLAVTSLGRVDFHDYHNI
jgi:hypothetical protein